MPSDTPLRVAVTLRRDAPQWHHGVVDAVIADCGLRIAELFRIESTINPQSAILNPQYDAVIDLAGVAESAVGPRLVEPRLGVWRFGFGDGATVADGAPGTWARLYRLTADPDRAVVLHEGWYRTRTREAWGTKSVGGRVAAWPARVLRQIHQGDQRGLDRAAQSTTGCCALLPPDAPGRVGAAAIDAVDALRSWTRRQRWTIGIVPHPIEEIMQRGRIPEPVWLAGQPRDRFYADPFPLSVCGDRIRLLAEEYIYPSRAKRLGEIEIARTGAMRRCHANESLPQPASYPFLLREDGRLFCMPETSGNQSVSAFVSDDDGRSWRHDGDLMTGFPFVDATFVEHDGYWWMFCTKQGDEDQTDLYVFFATGWRGPWQPHPLNPVKSDTRSSRPAGACFTIDGHLHRPAQNCARRYGAGITINRVVELSPSAFREEPVLSLQPSEASPWPDGMHTINCIGGVTIVDGLRVEQRAPQLLARLKPRAPAES